MRFSPGASGLTTPAVRVAGLEPHANYTFTVEAQNGVSGLDSTKQASASLSISMGHAGEESREGLEETRGLRTPGRKGWTGSDGKATQVISSFLPNPLEPCGLAESLSGLSLRLVRKEPRQLELSWAGGWPRSPGGNLSYELHVLNQVRTRLGDRLRVWAWHTPTS